MPIAGHSHRQDGLAAAALRLHHDRAPARVLRERLGRGAAGTLSQQGHREEGHGADGDPLRLEHSRFFSDEIVGFNVAAPHVLVDGKPVVDPAAWPIERAGNPNGGLISSVRDQLRYARFHLGDGKAPNGRRVLSRKSLIAMRSRPG